MLYRILRRILRRHALFHLLIPLIGGVIVEVLYSLLWDRIGSATLPTHLLSGHRIALYIGIVFAYILVIGIKIKYETNIGLRQLDMNALAGKLKDAQGLFAVGTMRFEEWFDPAVQVYLATVFSQRLTAASFRYERVLLLATRSARKDLNSDYLDGYHAKCLIDIHKRLGIHLYFLEWPAIIEILHKLSATERVHVGFYPSIMARIPESLAKLLMWPIGRRRRVRKLAVGIIEAASGSKSAFRFSKHAKIVSVQFQPQERAEACVRFVDLIRAEIYSDATNTVKPTYDFTSYY